MFLLLYFYFLLIPMPSYVSCKALSWGYTPILDNFYPYPSIFRNFPSILKTHRSLRQCLCYLFILCSPWSRYFIFSKNFCFVHFSYQSFTRHPTDTCSYHQLFSSTDFYIGFIFNSSLIICMICDCPFWFYFLCFWRIFSVSVHDSHPYSTDSLIILLTASILKFFCIFLLPNNVAVIDHILFLLSFSFR